MIKRSGVEFIDFSEKEDEKPKSYCRKCREYGFLVELKNRIYLDNQPTPADHENWKMCYECGLIVPIYEIEKESRLKDVIETSENPFDSGKDFLGVDNRKARKKKQRDRERELDHIKDDDLRRELASGQTQLISYTES